MCSMFVAKQKYVKCSTTNITFREYLAIIPCADCSQFFSNKLNGAKIQTTYCTCKTAVTSKAIWATMNVIYDLRGQPRDRSSQHNAVNSQSSPKMQQNILFNRDLNLASVCPLSSRLSSFSEVEQPLRWVMTSSCRLKPARRGQKPIFEVVLPWKKKKVSEKKDKLGLN